MTWQRWQTHIIRNMLSLVLKKDRAKILSYLKEITESKNLESARKRLGAKRTLREYLKVKLSPNALYVFKLVPLKRKSLNKNIPIYFADQSVF